MLSAGGDKSALALLPKPELHLHLEGCLTPALVAQLAARHGETLTIEQAAARFEIASFSEFLELFKWATSYLRRPGDYALLAAQAVRDLTAQNCIYAEITLSVGVMLLRKQDVHANFDAISETTRKVTDKQRTRIQWIFDAVRQFGSEKAMEVARLAAQMKSHGVVAFGIGGDEESLPAADFRKVFEYAASEGLHRVAHAGEMGGPQSILDAIEILGAERIGHGISAIRDEKLMDLLINRQIPLEICPTSNLCTGALAKLLGVKQAHLEDHPLPKFVARGVPVTLASDDPGMFCTSLNAEYAAAHEQIGLTIPQLTSIAEAGFRHSFLLENEKHAAIENYRSEAKRLHLL
jgi:aminodeoxyfutalosine deaminase